MKTLSWAITIALIFFTTHASADGDRKIALGMIKMKQDMSLCLGLKTTSSYIGTTLELQKCPIHHEGELIPSNFHNWLLATDSLPGNLQYSPPNPIAGGVCVKPSPRDRLKLVTVPCSQDDYPFIYNNTFGDIFHKGGEGNFAITAESIREGAPVNLFLLPMTGPLPRQEWVFVPFSTEN